jgi:hypothetical protein
MAGEKELTLMMRIRANAQDAQQVVQRFMRDIKKLSGEVRDYSDSARTGFRMAGGAVSAFFAPMGALVRIAGAGTVAMTAIGAAAVKSASEFESYRARLEAVMATEKQAAKAFEETRKFAAATPFETGDLVGARIILEGIGLSGVKSLKSVGNAAAAMGRSVTDMASLMGGIEAEPLRRLGIQIKRSGDTAEFEFRDRMGRLRKISATGAMQIRQELLGIFDIKFGGATTKLSTSFAGLLSTLKDNITMALAQIGEGMLPSVKKIVGGLGGTLDKMLEGGELKNLGVQIGDMISKFAAEFGGIVDQIKSTAETIRQAWTDGPETFRTVAGEALKSGATVFGRLFIETIGATADIWVGIGKILAAPFIESVMQLPGMGFAREKMAQSAVTGMSVADRRKLADDMGIFMPNDFLAGDAFVKNMRDQDQLRLITGSGAGAKLMQEGVGNFTKGLPARVDRIWGDASAEWKAFSGAVAPIVGVSSRAQQDYRAGERDPGLSVYSYGVMTNAGPEPYGSFTAPRGKFKVGQRAPEGGHIIKIERLEVRADNTRILQNELLSHVGPGSAVFAQ